MAESTRASIVVPRGCSNRTCPSRSSTGWPSMTASRSTMSTEGPKTTIPSADHRAAEVRGEWDPANGMSSKGGMASTKRSSRVIRISSTPSIRTAAWRDWTARPVVAWVSSRFPAPASHRTVSIGTLRCSSVPTTRSGFGSRATRSSAATTGATRGLSPAPTSPVGSTATGFR